MKRARVMPPGATLVNSLRSNSQRRRSFAPAALAAGAGGDAFATVALPATGASAARAAVPSIAATNSDNDASPRSPTVLRFSIPLL